MKFNGSKKKKKKCVVNIAMTKPLHTNTVQTNHNPIDLKLVKPVKKKKKIKHTKKATI